MYELILKLSKYFKRHALYFCSTKSGTVPHDLNNIFLIVHVFYPSTMMVFIFLHGQKNCNETESKIILKC